PLLGDHLLQQALGGREEVVHTGCHARCPPSRSTWGAGATRVRVVGRGAPRLCRGRPPDRGRIREKTWSRRTPRTHAASVAPAGLVFRAWHRRIVLRQRKPSAIW